MRFYSAFLHFYKSKFIVDYVYFVIHIYFIIHIQLLVLSWHLYVEVNKFYLLNHSFYTMS